MVVMLIKPKENIQYDITEACASYSWSGSASEAVRSFSFEYLNAPYDNTLRLPQVVTGDFVSLSDDREGEVFYGQIYGVEKSSQIGTITYTAVDAMKHLLESNVREVYRNMTPEAIATKVCADAQVPIRYLYPTGINIKSMICNEKSMYDVIMAAYTKAHKITGDKYFAMIYKRGLGVYKAEWIVSGFTLSDSDNIFSSDIQETMDEIKNQVLIYNEKGKRIGEVKDDTSLSDFGVFQEVYTQEKGVDAVTAAKSKLKTLPSQTIKISAIGDINCLSCYYVIVNDGATGLSGRYWIASDKHTWDADGNYTMELELRFEALMTEKEAEEEKAKKKG